MSFVSNKSAVFGALFLEGRPKSKYNIACCDAGPRVAPKRARLFFRSQEALVGARESLRANILEKSFLMAAAPSLYGLSNSNRNFSDPYYWGKNQFNSSFPAALACYMRDQRIPAVYLSLTKQAQVQVSAIPISEVFGTNLDNSELYFAFESAYEPFRKYVEDQLPPIDLVVKNLAQEYIRPLEIKLTTLPDDATSELPEEEYGSEIVVRAPTTKYMALSIAQGCDNSQHKERIRQLFKPCQSIRDWTNAVEAKSRLAEILDTLDVFFTEFARLQKPLLMQPIWKTEGKSPVLAGRCLDIFVWSDFALSRLFMDSAKRDAGERITRQQRAALRFARFIFEWSRGGKVFQAPIYDGMTYDTLNDKEFSISGRKTNAYMRCERLTNLAVKRESIKEIILGGGQKFLSPERRFDAIIYFSTNLFKEK